MKIIHFIKLRISNLILIAKLLPQLINSHQNLLGLLKLVWMVFRTQGIRGLKARVAAINYRKQNGLGYERWMEQFESYDPDVLLRDIQQFEQQPLISVIMPTYNAKVEWLVEAIESIRSQLYSNWQLCIADDASTDPAIKPLLMDYQAKDPRITVVFREKNGHIAEASNSAIATAKGDWLALIDHDDVIVPHAFYCIAKAINDHPNAGLIYSDEDKLNVHGKRCDPYFKSGFNYDLLLSQNMITHLGCYRADLVKQIGGFRSEYNGAQDYDLALRMVALLKTEQIVHIPRVLYHWRIHPESTASANEDSKPYAHLAAMAAIQAHLTQQNIAAEVVPSPEVMGMNRVRYLLPKTLPSVEIIIPTKDMIDVLKVCVDSIALLTSYQHYSITIVNNRSEKAATFEQLKAWETLGLNGIAISVIDYDAPFNFSAINNFAVNQSSADYVCLLNNDIEVISPDWLSEMVSQAMQAGVGAVGARLWYPNDTLQHGGVVLLGDLIAGHAHKGLPKGACGYAGRANVSQNFSAVTAACLLVSRENYLSVNGLDEASFQVAFNDVDFCLKLAEKNLRNVWTPYAELYHHESLSRGYETTSKAKLDRFKFEQENMRSKWGSLLFDDPHYSPNLTLDFQDFSQAKHPRIQALDAPIEK